MKEIVIATGNKHKILEINEILCPFGWTAQSIAAYGGMPEVVEDAMTFDGNARKKALAGALAIGRPVLADDSGLEVTALGGAPGVHSARYAGEGGNDGRNLAKLLKVMEGLTDRRARFVCVIAVARPDGWVGTAEGEVTGRIALIPAGSGGFGYDPVFIPDGHEQSFGELPSELKNGMSHRANALKAAIRSGLLAS
jgi:XTP/dITP diphosphohydrolase